ncbi:MAG: hypothetical protein JW873_03520 [Candidatus Saganbacteria bacterium]|nr:hypothetical protein [Candidatus Saganbacteria bacterium]
MKKTKQYSTRFYIIFCIITFGLVSILMNFTGTFIGRMFGVWLPSGGVLGAGVAGAISAAIAWFIAIAIENSMQKKK